MPDYAPPQALSVHQLTTTIPMMKRGEWEVFLADIRERGILEPLQLATDGTTVLDGRHRLQAALELGLATVPVVPAQLGDLDESEYVVRQALLRRNLSDDQRALLAAQRAKELSSARQHEAARLAAQSRWGECAETTVVSPHQVRTRQLLSESYGVSERKIRYAQLLAEQTPELAAAVLTGNLPLHKALRQAKRQTALAMLKSLPELSPTEQLQVWCGDFRDVGRQIPDESIDLVLTDPPYDKAGMALWEDFARFARQKLKPSAFCVAYCGQLYLREAMTSLDKCLTYYWLAGLRHVQQHTQCYVRHSFNAMKAILIYVKEPLVMPPAWFVDLINNPPGPDKRFHDWQQSIEPVRYLVSRFSRPGEVVLDPFAGSGTTALAALLEKRRAIAIELSPHHAETIRKRSQEFSTQSRVPDQAAS